MLSEDNHSPLYSLLKTLRQLAHPLSPRPLHPSLGFVCRCGWGQSYGSEWLPQSEAHNEKGSPVSITADVLCSLTDVSIFMFFFLFWTVLLYEPLMFGVLKEQGLAEGFTRAKEQVWEYDRSIWAVRGGNLCLWATGDHFSVVITGDFNVQIYRSSYNLGLDWRQLC